MPHNDTVGAFLRGRSGLDEDWLDRDENDIPHPRCEFPTFLSKQLSTLQGTRLQNDLDRLVAAGCRRGALHFCLAQLSPEARAIRAGQRWTSLPGKEGADDNSSVRTPVRLATKEDLESVVHKTKAAHRAIKKYSDELLLAAAVNESPLPDGMFTKFTDADEALYVLVQSLKWAEKLTSAYTAVAQNTLLKAKGVLYLVAYVSMCTDPNGNIPGMSNSKPGIPSVTRLPAPMKTLGDVVRLCTAKRFAPSALQTKMRQFERKYPKLFAKLKTKLLALHRHSQ